MTNTVKATLLVRHDTSSNWISKNPVLSEGEFGLETNTFLIKIGDGVSSWLNLPYLNKLNASYFKKNDDGTITFSDSFLSTINALESNWSNFIQYVDQAILAAGHLRREVVEELPAVADADEDTMYMIRVDDHYEEYMVINGVFDIVGVTGEGTAYTLPVATNTVLGGVRSSTNANQIAVGQDGFMTLNQVSTSLLYVPTGDTLVLYGGNA